MWRSLCLHVYFQQLLYVVEEVDSFTFVDLYLFKETEKFILLFLLCFKEPSNTRTRRAAENTQGNEEGTFSRYLDKKKSKTLVNATLPSSILLLYIIIFYVHLQPVVGESSSNFELPSLLAVL